MASINPDKLSASPSTDQPQPNDSSLRECAPEEARMIEEFFEADRQELDQQLDLPAVRARVRDGIRRSLAAREQALNGLVWLADLRGSDEAKAGVAFANIIQTVDPALRDNLEPIARGHPECVEDAIQETWLNFWRHRSKWPDGDQGLYNLFRLVRQLVLRRIRRNTVALDRREISNAPATLRSRVRLSASRGIVASAKVHFSFNIEELVRRIQLEFPDFPQKSQDLLRAYWTGGVTSEQCQKLGILPAQARKQLASSLRRLKSLLTRLRLQGPAWRPSVTSEEHLHLGSGGQYHESHVAGE
jgi:DNA-directed RNA polymerase specialized sigma24 family protein